MLERTDWIADMPDRWEKRPIFALFSERGETNDGYKTNNVLSVLKDVGVINYEDKGDIGNKKSEDIERYKIVYAGDLVINSMNVIIGSVGVSSEYGALSPVYIVLKPRSSGVDMRYYGHVFASRDFQQWLTRIGYGILAHRMRIPLDNLKREYVPYPPLIQQTNIADFLDRETAKSDALVAKYERLIELLEEKRIALITHAVTKGLGPNMPMKDSGVEWIGKIPADWNVVRLKFNVTKIGSGVTPRGGAEAYTNEGVTFLRSQNIYDDGLRLDDVAYVSEAVDAEMARTRVQENDVLLNITGASIGRTCIVPASALPANVNQHVCIIRPVALIEPKFLSYALKSHTVREQIFGGENGSSREGLNYEQVGNLMFACPPSQIEQSAIVNALELRLQKISQLSDRCSKAIALVRERRGALITAAVTGQFDVRTYKAKDLEEVVA